MRNTIKKWLWPVLEQPWRSDVMEFHYGLWNGISALYSASGRQLGEENTRPFVLNHHLAAETIACKYDGSRMGRTINISALRTAMQNFDGALGVTGAVRRFHMDRTEGSDILGIWDLYIIARASIALIAFQKRSVHQRSQRPDVPDVLASQYQFISGIFMICRAMMQSADPRIMANTRISSADLFAYADAQGIFISPNGWACAGSTKKIMEFIEFCNHGSLVQSAKETGLAEIVNHPGTWYAYALACVELDCLCEAERVWRAGLAQPKRSDECSAARAIYQSIGAYCRSLDADLDAIGDARPFAKAALLRQNRILSLLGRPQVTVLPNAAIEKRLGGEVLTPAPQN